MANLKSGEPTMSDGALYRLAGLRTMESGTSVKLYWKDGTFCEEIAFSLARRAR